MAAPKNFGAAFFLQEHAAWTAAQRLEGSRFVMLQLYRLAAGGSRERLQMLSPPSVQPRSEMAHQR
jgi:hypothetical protein